MATILLTVTLVLLAGVLRSDSTDPTEIPRFCPKLNKSTRVGPAGSEIFSGYKEKACACYTACENTAECQMWDFHKQSHTCKMYDQTSTLTFNGAHQSGIKSDTCNRLDMSDRPGSDINTVAPYTYTNEPCDCDALCALDPTCLSWSWSKKSFECKLKNGVPDLIKPDNTHVSRVMSVPS
ncbi:uncharacterized protein LOC100377131 [Saccoglossus kowalevskii]|uniref:Uncharacterized protein LOC100377131 n=1 Tax=Saccoglossus kowalevskii TaxID=10224 RepID=A0ABM0GTH2_SACKO|nr:PREDICTED: uncharacterized protein LOC100377131 [Saccoglossus kowalevskii]